MVDEKIPNTTIPLYNFITKSDHYLTSFVNNDNAKGFVLSDTISKADEPKEDDEDNDFAEHDDDIALKEIDVKKRKSDEFSLPNIDAQSIKRIKDASNIVGSIQANDRLLKELSIIYKSDDQNEIFTVNLIDDRLDEWEVGIKEVDSDSELMKELNKCL
ncbi:ubiquitin-conjugating enzyme E2 Q2-like [Cotesia glomerata]|uniref:ubiquitin-conjugating enzyme E2 Q2-like n=1 Tax=Cotesia glomerata TaxID=32391 RepID=UPI001D0028A9|nr:ubiquitin-conjugating enzyme E2 Q2-like [Cotesia glomerata]